jgi:hypothetical protein
MFLIVYTTGHFNCTWGGGSFIVSYEQCDYTQPWVLHLQKKTTSFSSFNHDINNKLWNNVSTDIYTPYAGTAGMLNLHKWKVHSEKIEIISFVHNYKV